MFRYDQPYDLMTNLMMIMLIMMTDLVSIMMIIMMHTWYVFCMYNPHVQVYRPTSRPYDYEDVYDDGDYNGDDFNAFSLSISRFALLTIDFGAVFIVQVNPYKSSL